MTKDPTERREPPKSEDEWGFLWQAAAKANEGWIVVGPIVAAVKNWKAWLVIGGLFVWMNRPDIMQALQTLMGAGQ